MSVIFLIIANKPLQMGKCTYHCFSTKFCFFKFNSQKINRDLKVLPNVNRIRHDSS